MEGDEGTFQPKGLIIVSASRSPFKMEQFDRIMTKRIYQVRTYIPIRVVAYHAIIKSASPTFLKLFVPYALWLMGRELRSRFKLHIDSSDDEILASLATYGIVQLPIVAGGSFQFDGDAWFQERRQVEARRQLGDAAMRLDG